MLFVVPAHCVLVIDDVISIVGVCVVAIQPHLQSSAGDQGGTHLESKLLIGKLLSFQDAHTVTMRPGLQCRDNVIQPMG